MTHDLLVLLVVQNLKIVFWSSVLVVQNLKDCFLMFQFTSRMVPVAHSTLVLMVPVAHSTLVLMS